MELQNEINDEILNQQKDLNTDDDRSSQELEFVHATQHTADIHDEMEGNATMIIHAATDQHD